MQEGECSEEEGGRRECNGLVWSEEENGLVDEAEQTSFTGSPDMVSYDRENGPTPTAPPAYTPIYPPLQ